MMALHSFPRCTAYLKAMRCRLDDPEMTDYAWAVVLSDAWTDDELVAVGTVNFDTMTGDQLLPELEKLLAVKAQSAPLSPADAESLKAFIGARGVKVSSLTAPEDYWHVASILWPHTVKQGERGKLKSLLCKIRGMTKAQRRTAAVNIKAVPRKWLPTARPSKLEKSA